MCLEWYSLGVGEDDALIRYQCLRLRRQIERRGARKWTYRHSAVERYLDPRTRFGSLLHLLPNMFGQFDKMGRLGLLRAAQQRHGPRVREGHCDG